MRLLRMVLFLRTLLLLLGAGASTLVAQLDPRLQAGNTDFLDLYQAGGRETVKPEILTVLDFSGSMNQIMFHRNFPNLDTEENPFGNYNIQVAVTRSGGSGPYSLDTAQGVWRAFNGTTTNRLTIGGTNYDFQIVALVKPDGTLVTDTDAQNHVVNNTEFVGSTNGSADVRNWIRCASHARVRCTFSGTTRIVDLPIPWTILNASSTGRPLQAVQVTDAKTGTLIELDTNHRGSSANQTYLQNASGGSTATAAYVGTRSSAGVPLYRVPYIRWIFTAKDASNNYIVPDAATQPLPFNNGLVNLTRLQAVKVAVIRTWVKYQDQVFWAVRGLQVPNQNNNYDATTNTPVSIALPPGNSTTGANSQWSFFNSSPLDGARRLSKLIADSGTPLTRSLVHSYIQMQDNSPWDRVHHLNSPQDDQRPADCLRHFVLLFTDGVPNVPDDVDTATEAFDRYPYEQGADGGNQRVAGAGVTSIDYKGFYWNVPTLAGVAAHGGDTRLAHIVKNPSAQNTGNSGSPSSYAPFYIRNRRDGSNPVYTFPTPHPIQTMTIGVSLGATAYLNGEPVSINQEDANSPRYRLLAAAAYGDPLVSTPEGMRVSNKGPFRPAPNGKAAEGTVYYFDAQDPDSLVDNLDRAINAVNAISKTGVASAPTVPFSGLALARQVYLSYFQVPEPATPRWSGDLVMFPTITEGLRTRILTSGNAVVDTVDAATAENEAQWSARKMFDTPNFWATRRIYTRPSATASNPTPGLVNFTDQPGTDFDAFKNDLPAGSDGERQALVSWMRGADTSRTPPYPNRPNLMADVIGSAPAALEYALASPLASYLGVDASQPNARVRVIFVGTNDGYLHAIGESSYEGSTDIGGVSVTTVRASAKVLWSFLPTDFLPYFIQNRDDTNPHRLGVDGVPSVYHVDIPATGRLAGNGRVDASERALVIFGLGKGGRSYYALDVNDPMNPRMAWALRPDEAATIPNSRVLTGAPADVRTLISNMGFSTPHPGIGRVLFTQNGELRVKSATFLGGGQSDPNVEMQFPDLSGNPTPLGRSVIALDTFTGEVLQSWNLSGRSGPIPAGVMPFEFFPGSGLVQRAYFTDKNGGLWALGSGKRSGTPGFEEFRLDSNEIDRWTNNGEISGTPLVRKIYQGPARDLHSTSPAAFNVSAFPAYRTTDPRIAPATVGIAFVSGDRNNPIDLRYTAATQPSRHRINVVFDRQDSPPSRDLAGIQDADLVNMSGQTDSAAAVITPSNDAYYLKSKLGYYINFPNPQTVGTQVYIPKGINEPTVLAGVLFYSYFRPTTGDICNPGGGLTRSWRVCDVINPVVSTANVASSATCMPGFVLEWAGVASNFGARGTVAVNQAGGVLKAGEGGDTGSGASDGSKISIGTATGSYSETFPKPRVWRSVHGDQ